MTPISNNTEISRAISAIYTLIEGLRKQESQSSLNINTVTGKLRAIEEQTNKLIRTVYEGNGQHSILTKIAKIENNAESLQKEYREQLNNLKIDISELEENVRKGFLNVEKLIKELEAKENAKSQAVVSGGWDIAKAVIAAILISVISSAAVGLLSTKEDAKLEQLLKSQEQLIRENEARIEKLIVENNK